jgi:D-alanine-D-alanine ligase
MRIGLTYNLKKELPQAEGSDYLPPDFYAEFDDFETIEAIQNALAREHEIIPIEADENAFKTLQGEKPDIVFNIAEGIRGVSREAQIPAMLEFLHIPYTGSDPLTLSLCLDKVRCKEILSYHHLPTPRFKVLTSVNGNGNAKFLRYPLLVKPCHEGSSKGIYNNSLVYDARELSSKVKTIFKDYHQPALAEEFLDGKEFTVALLGNGKEVKTLPIIELDFDQLPPDANRIYSFEAKWIWDTVDNPLKIFRCPAEIDEEPEGLIKSLAIRAYRIMRCRDWCRIDIRLDSYGLPHILELNPLPGILPRPENNSCFPKAARAAGMSYDQLILEVLHIACKRYGITHEQM